MAGGMQQSMNVSMQQVLAPQLQQSLAILQAPILELRTLIQQELEENPVLEEEDFVEETTESQEDDNFEEEFEMLSKLDEEWREYMAQSNSYSSRGEEEEERRQHFFDSLVNPETLQQHLLTQLHSSELPPDRFRIGELLIGNIDDNGFLQATPQEIAANTGIALEELEVVLPVIQGFHPVGVGAIDLRECLLIQLKRLGKEGTLEWRMVDQHLQEVAKKRFPELARKFGTTVEQIQRAANFISTLSPRPGQIFSSTPQQYILPDVLVEKIGDEYMITLNGEQIPHLRISNTYKDLIATRDNKDGVRDYIRDKIRSGKFLIKSIHQRQQTIWNITNEIVTRQHDFLEKGPSALRPMTMSQVADAVGVHETTVSRAISGKFIATPQGTYEMKYFFTPGYQTESGDILSNTSVKNTILDLVRNENPKSPLSDKEIVEILSEQGIPIARRTVAKYRNELHILPSNMRRQY